MAQPATNPKIEELRYRIKTDPKSRLFYQLAEELRKVKSFDEAEEVLRAGLTHNPTYLAAWVSLGRTLREKDKHQDSIDAFTRALQIDPGNVVAARLMADAYLDLGDKVEAIKKYKLVRALLPVDEELNAIIDRLDDEINPVTILKADAVEVEAPAPPAPEPAAPARAPEPEPQPPAAAASFDAVDESPFAPDDTLPQREAESVLATADAEPMRVAHEQSPFEEPVAPSATAAAFDVEQPLGMHVEPAPVTAEVPAPAPWPDEEPVADVFEPAEQAPAAPMATEPAADDAANTVTMADLYVQQGFLDRAQSIYESILDKDPNNDSVRAKLDALESRPSRTAPVDAAPQKNQKTDKLEKWLAKVKRAEERSV